MKILMACLIICGAIFSGVGVACAQQGGGYLQPAPQKEHPEVPRITAAEVRKLFMEGKVLLANAHEREVFDGKHLYGSISIPNGGDYLNIDLPRDVVVAFYCE